MIIKKCKDKRTSKKHILKGLIEEARKREISREASKEEGNGLNATMTREEHEAQIRHEEQILHTPLRSDSYAAKSFVMIADI